MSLVRDGLKLLSGSSIGLITNHTGLTHDGVPTIDVLHLHERLAKSSLGPRLRAPDLAGRIAGISLMGGGTFGNRTAVAEFNIWADPEAAAIVFGYGGPLVMAGLDVTHQFQATPERIAAVRAMPGRLADVLADLFDFFSGTLRGRHDDIAGAPVHDPLRGAGAHPSRPVRARRRATSPSRPTASSPAA